MQIPCQRPLPLDSSSSSQIISQAALTARCLSCYKHFFQDGYCSDRAWAKLKQSLIRYGVQEQYSNDYMYHRQLTGEGEGSTDEWHMQTPWTRRRGTKKPRSHQTFILFFDLSNLYNTQYFFLVTRTKKGYSSKYYMTGNKFTINSEHYCLPNYYGLL